MHYVVLRDDDTSALTPASVLDRLYRPFLDRGLPVHLSVIPNVDTRVRLADGSPEWYLPNDPSGCAPTVPIGANPALVAYLRANPDFRIVQHGYEHTFREFLTDDARAIAHALDRGTDLLLDAGFERPGAFVAPQDRISGAALRHLVRRFSLVSTCWFERAQMSGTWWWPYLQKKILRRPHWQLGTCSLLSHPGSLLTHTRDHGTLLEGLRRSVLSRRLTVVVTHWWEYFRRERFDEPLLDVLHETADWLSSDPDVRLVSFDEIAAGTVPLH